MFQLHCYSLQSSILNAFPCDVLWCAVLCCVVLCICCAAQVVHRVGVFDTTEDVSDDDMNGAAGGGTGPKNIR